MKNQEIARMFYEMAEILELKEVKWKPQAYRKAARGLESLGKDVEEVYKEGGLNAVEDIPGVGERLALKIEEYIKTGKIKSYAKYKKSIPKGLNVLMSIPGLGPKKAKQLYGKLGIKSIKDLEKAVKKHKIKGLEHFKEKSEENIERGIELVKSKKGRMLLGNALPIAEDILHKLKGLKEVRKAEIAGSLRRMNDTIGDIDILITSRNPKPVMDFFTKMPEVSKVLARGPTKSSVLFKAGIQVDLRVLEEKSFGSGLQYFTGSKDHNIKLREIAIKKGLKLSEYGLFSKKSNRQVAGSTEKEVYSKLGMKYIEPELRENTGEIAAAIKGKLPSLVKLSDIKGDIHAHSKWSDGSASIEEMALAAKRLGHEYIAITDHSKSQRIVNGLTEDRVLQKIKEVRKVNSKIRGIKVLMGAEVDILKDGSMDYSDSLLKKIDIVVGAVHSSFKMPRAKMTARIIKAMENKNVNVIAHPTGRLIGEREGCDIDFQKVFQAAKATNTALEINAAPSRMDLSQFLAKEAADHGVKLVIGTDAHAPAQLAYMRLGVGIARKSWCQKAQILNTCGYYKLIQYFRKWQ